MQAQFCTKYLLVIFGFVFNSQLVYGSPNVGQENSSVFVRNQCIDAIRRLANNPDVFWYGNSYRERCPPEKQQYVSCLDLHNKPRTLAQALMGVDNPDLSKLDRTLSVSYTSPPGTYSGCDTSVTKDATIQFTVNPLSRDIHEPWTMRERPKLSWTVDDRNDYYTWIMYDPGFKFSHAIYMNILDNDLQTSNVVQEYGGPLNQRYIPNTYSFVIFKQKGYVDVSNEKPDNSNFNVTAFARKYDLEGPVALTWTLVSTDAYALQTLASQGYINNCATLIEKAYNEKHDMRSFLPNPLQDLSVSVSLTVNSPAFTYSCGGSNFSMETKRFTLDAPGMEIYSPALTRTGTTRDVVLTPNKFQPKMSDLNDKCYVIAMVDPDIRPPFTMFVGNEDKPLMHELVVGLRQVDGRIVSGGYSLPYKGPQPPDNEPHTYYLMLYEDPNCVSAIDTKKYAGAGCMEMLKERCFFDVNGMVRDYNLKLVGLTWIRAKKDHYVECLFAGDPLFGSSNSLYTPLKLFMAMTSFAFTFLITM